MGQKVCFLVTEHPFLDARIFKKEAKSLVRHGYDVTMIVPRRNGNLFAIDGRPFEDIFQSQTFEYEGVNIITYEQIDYEKHLKRLHQTLAATVPNGWTDALIQLGIEQEADIYHAHEFFSVYSGVEIKRTLAAKGNHCKLIYDSHELEPDPLSKESKSKKLLKEQLLKMMFKEIDHVITVSESIQKWYQTINPSLPIEIIYNSPPLAHKKLNNLKKTGDFVLAFEGVLGKKRGNAKKLFKLVEAANEQINLKVKIIGGWKREEQTPFIPLHLKDKVLFTGWLKYDEIPFAMEDVDLGWIDLDSSRSLNHRFAMPNKFFSYLNNGVPVLINQCDDMKQFIERYKCGYMVDKPQASAHDYAEAILWLYSRRDDLKKMGINARKQMESAYSWEHMEKRLLGIYNHLCSVI